MVSVDELKERFGPAVNVAPFGECIVIQGDKFDPDWEADLGDQGFACHFGDFDGRPVTFVRLKKAVAEGKVVYVPPKKPQIVHGNVEVKKLEKEASKQNRGNPRLTMTWAKDAQYWSPEEDALLIELWKKKLPVKEIYLEVHRKYPKRTELAVSRRIYPLQKKGLIEKRHKPKLKAAKVPNDTSAIKSEKSKYGIIEAAPEATISTSITAKLEKAAINFSAERWSKEDSASLLAEYDKVVFSRAGKKYGSVHITALSAAARFKGRTVDGIAQKIDKLLHARRKRIKREQAKQEPAKPYVEPRAFEPEVPPLEESPQEIDVQILPIDLNDKSSESKPDFEVALVDLTLETKRQIDSLKKEYFELKEDFDAYAKMQSEIFEADREDLKVLTAKCEQLQKKLANHKHADSGEAMLPMEATSCKT